jgi:hypothetical protein
MPVMSTLATSVLYWIDAAIGNLRRRAALAPERRLIFAAPQALGGRQEAPHRHLRDGTSVA